MPMRRAQAKAVDEAPFMLEPQQQGGRCGWCGAEKLKKTGQERRGGRRAWGTPLLGGLLDHLSPGHRVS